jgi:hypothetical protein
VNHHPLYPQPERIIVRRIRKGLLSIRDGVEEVGSVGNDLGQLAACHIVAGTEGVV